MIDFLTALIARYDQLLGLISEEWRGPTSLAVLLILAGTIWHVIRKSGIWLALLVILIPALLPPLKGVGEGLLFLARALLERAKL